MLLCLGYLLSTASWFHFFLCDSFEPIRREVRRHWHEQSYTQPVCVCVCSQKKSNTEVVYAASSSSRVGTEMNFSLGYCLEAAGVIVLSLRFQLCSIFFFFFLSPLWADLFLLLWGCERVWFQSVTNRFIKQINELISRLLTSLPYRHIIFFSIEFFFKNEMKKSQTEYKTSSAGFSLEKMEELNETKIDAEKAHLLDCANTGPSFKCTHRWAH